MDVGFLTDLANFKKGSHFDVSAQLSQTFGSKGFLVNPRFSIFADGTVDVSLAGGIRHDLGFGVLGHHVFWDCSTLKEVKFNQFGHSLDLLTERFDYRINYYHPLVEKQRGQKYVYTSHRWVEGEMIWKNDFCQVGGGPKFDFFDQKVGVQARLMIPFKYVHVSTMASYDPKNKLSGCFSISFPLFNNPRKSPMHAPIFHRTRVQYTQELIEIPYKKSHQEKEGNLGLTKPPVSPTSSPEKEEPSESEGAQEEEPAVESTNDQNHPSNDSSGFFFFLR